MVEVVEVGVDKADWLHKNLSVHRWT